MGGCGGGGRESRGDKRGKTRRYNLIYLDGVGCTADPSKDGYYPRVEIATDRVLRNLKAYSGGHKILEANQILRAGEEMLGEL